MPAVGGEFERVEVFFERTEGSIGLDDRPRVFAVIGRDGRATAAVNGDVEIADAGVGDGEDAVALAAVGLERGGDRRCALGDGALERGLREAVHAVLGAAQEPEAGHVFHRIAGGVEAPVAADPRAADAHRRRRVAALVVVRRGEPGVVERGIAGRVGRARPRQHRRRRGARRGRGGRLGVALIPRARARLAADREGREEPEKQPARAHAAVMPRRGAL